MSRSNNSSATTQASSGSGSGMVTLAKGKLMAPFPNLI